MGDNNHFSQIVSSFHGLPLPDAGMTLAGYSALIAHYDLQVPFPDCLAAISAKHKRYTKDRWAVFTVKHKPHDTLAGHLTFALKHEGVDLGVLNALFKKITPAEIEAVIKNGPTGQYSRRVWFLYEWLTERRLEIADVTTGNYTEALDSNLQYPGPSTPSKRHRVRNNLPGTRNFCPLIRRTEKLETLIAAHLSEKAKEALGAVHPDVLARAAAFLLLKDSKASYAIEGEQPAYTRAQRWGQAIGQAGSQKLIARELLRLQEIVIVDKRFTKMGWRKEGGFIGVHDRVSNAPIPDHISARWQDIAALIDGLIATNEKLSASDYDPVLAATLIAFGFVFIHPFEDGNGRIHRYLIHHVLVEKGFAPKGIVFPVSAVILERIDEYRRTLEAYSKPRLGLVEWEPTRPGNVEVRNETIDLYRYFDATPQAEFLFDCVRQTIEKTLPEEVAYLSRHDEMSTFIKDHFDMPDKVSENLIAFLRQGNGKLSKRAREQDFHKLTGDEIDMLEEKFAEIFSKTRRCMPVALPPPGETEKHISPEGTAGFYPSNKS